MKNNYKKRPIQPMRLKIPHKSEIYIIVMQENQKYD